MSDPQSQNLKIETQPSIPEKTFTPESASFVPEQENIPETTEVQAPQEAKQVEQVIQKAPTIKTKPLQNKPQAIPKVRDEMTLKIEKIMEEDLKDAFTELTTVQKQQFKIKGEETAEKIKLLLTKTKINIKKVVKLLLEWLKILPGINKFFLEQEAKIKADKIIALKYFQQPV
jgi:hypothetical protein